MEQTETLGDRTIRKVRWRILPWIFFLYVIAYLDRVNIGFAALDMNKDLGITAAAFGFFSGVFFIGYALFEIPSNMLLHRYGARKWMARIMVTWGIISGLTMFVQNANQITILRVLLGICEAGFVPGMIYYMTTWFPEKSKAKAISIFYVAVPFSSLIGAPISTWIMSNVQLLDLPGWRWVFMVEAIPAVIAGIITFYYLTDKPAEAKWLAPDERNWLEAELRNEELANQEKTKVKNVSVGQVFKMRIMWQFAFIYFFSMSGGIAITFWLPQIIKGLSAGMSNMTVGLLAMIPYFLAAVAMWLNGIHSDKTGERRLHAGVPLLLQVIPLLYLIVATEPISKFVAITWLVIGSFITIGPYWAMPVKYLSGAALAVGTAFMVSICNVSGFTGNYIVGFLQGSFGTSAVFTYFLVAYLLAGLLTIAVPNEKRTVSSNEITKQG
jgi:ACS family tartrate transporter-like MFS transporter